MKNYSRTNYGAGTQTWEMTQDSRGFVYFANNSGILEFDGSHWTLYPDPNNSIIRSVAYGNDGHIYAGAYNEIGYLDILPSGKRVYHSLIDKIPPKYRNFDEVWKIYQFNDEIIFQSFTYLFIYKNGKFEVIRPFTKFGLSFVVRNKLYVVDTKKGIYELKGDKLFPFITGSSYYRSSEIRFMLPVNHDSLMIGYMDKGAYIYYNGHVAPWKVKSNTILIKNRLFSGIVLQKKYLAFGTIQDGLYITDLKGRIIQHLNRERGLQNNTVLSLYTDLENNLWLGLDNGLTYVESSSPSSIYNYSCGIESGYSSIVYKGILYFGTNQGLFAHKLDTLGEDFNQMDKFRIIEGTQGQVWSLSEIDGKLFCGHNNGVYLIQGFSAHLISNQKGGWMLVRSKYDPDIIFCGTYNGLSVFRKNRKNGSWVFSHDIKGFSESSRKLVQDGKHSIWISHGYIGIFHLILNDRLDSVVKVRLFTAADGLPAKLPYEVNFIRNKLLITTVKGCYAYDKDEDRLVPSVTYNKLFADNPSIRELQTDRQGNIWYFSNDKLGVYRRLDDGSYIDICKPFMRFSDLFITSYEDLYIYNDKNIIIGCQDGFIHLDPTIIKDYGNNCRTYIRNITLLKGTPDSVLSYQGNQNAIKVPYIKYGSNSLMFRYTNPFFEEPGKTQYRYRLTGYSSQWSKWKTRTFTEFTNLSSGRYTFEVESRNVYHSMAKPDYFSFVIERPFYKSRFAFALYVLLMIGFIGSGFLWIHFKHKRKFMKESDVVEKELARLNREKLMADVNHKNNELAIFSMHIIQKNSFLNKLKNELGEISDALVHDNNGKTALKQLIRNVDKELNNEKDFRIFDTYFDEVYQDFIRRFMKNHPALSAKELRLCAYIRMKISTDEIATLMNITPRGVEISQSRLSKKLNISQSRNLTEYILHF